MFTINYEIDNPFWNYVCIFQIKFILDTCYLCSSERLSYKVLIEKIVCKVKSY